MSWPDITQRGNAQRRALELHGYEVASPPIEQEARMRGHVRRCDCCCFELINGRVLLRSEPLSDNGVGWGRCA